MAAGGRTGGGRSDALDVFDTRSATWRSGWKLKQARSIAAAATAAGRYVFIAGGEAGVVYAADLHIVMLL